MSKLIVIFMCCTILQIKEAKCDIVQSVKDGFKSAYDDVHCAFHKVKELVHHHEHVVDPCNPKPKTNTEESTLKAEDFELLPKPTPNPENPSGFNTNYGNNYNRNNGDVYGTELYHGSNGDENRGSNYNGNLRPSYDNENYRPNRRFGNGPSSDSKPDSYGWREK